jgi:hypothetical protein
VLFNPDSVYYYLDKDIYKQSSKNAVIYADPYVKFGNVFSDIPQHGPVQAITGRTIRPIRVSETPEMRCSRS